MKKFHLTVKLGAVLLFRLFWLPIILVLALFLQPTRIKSLIPKGISSEIILIRYKQDAAIESRDAKIESEFTTNSKTDILQTSGQAADKMIGESITGNFTTAIVKGLELTTGQFIFTIDIDFPYPEELIPNLIAELVNSPNSIIVASKRSKRENPYNGYLW